MALNISKTDQVLVLLNRLAVSEDPTKLGSTEREYLLSSEDQCFDGELRDERINVDTGGQSSRRWSAMAKGPGTRRKSQDNEPAAALRIVLGDQRSSIVNERKLRCVSGLMSM